MPRPGNRWPWSRGAEPDALRTPTVSSSVPASNIGPDVGLDSPALSRPPSELLLASPSAACLAGSCSPSGLGSYGSTDVNQSAFGMGSEASSVLGDSAMALKQADWERQMDAADQKQAKLMHFHWNLIRDQIGTLVRELAGMRQEITGLQMSNTKSVSRHADVSRQVQQLQIEVEREAATRQRDDEAVQAAQRQIKLLMEEEGFGRGAKIDEAAKNAREALEAAAAEKADRSRTLQALEAQLQASLRTVTLSVDAERGERVARFESADQSLRMLQLFVENETRDRSAGEQELSKSLRELTSMVEVKAERSSLDRLISDSVSAMQRELVAEREQRGAISEHFESKLAEALRLEKSARESQLAPLAEELESSERRLREEVGRALGDQQANVDRQLAAERSARDEIRSSLVAQLQITEADLRRELSNVENDGSISQAEVRKMMLEHRDAVSRELKTELGRISNEQHAETSRLRDGHGVMRLQLEQAERKSRDDAAQLGARVESLDRALRGELGQLGADVQGATAAVRGEYATFLDQLEASTGSLRKELELVASRCESTSTKLKQEHGALRESLAALQQKVNDGSSLHDRHRSSEVALQGNLEAMRAELVKVVEENKASLVDFRASVDRQHSELNERFLRERTCRESGDGNAIKRFEDVERLVRDELAQRTAACTTLQQEVTTILDTCRAQLDAEKLDRKSEQEGIAERMDVLEVAFAAGGGTKPQGPGSVTKSEFDAEAQRIWDALDSHTHSMPVPDVGLVKETVKPVPPPVVEAARPQQAVVEVMRPQLLTQPLQPHLLQQEPHLAKAASCASLRAFPTSVASAQLRRSPAASPTRSFSCGMAGVTPLTSISVATRV